MKSSHGGTLTTAPIRGSNAKMPAISARYRKGDESPSVEANGAVALTATQGDVKVLNPLPAAPTRAESASFVATSRWEGAVSEKFATYFSAEVIDLTSGESAYVEFDLSEVASSDRALCEPGSLFYWATGYRVEAGGQRARSSVIMFRRRGAR